MALSGPLGALAALTAVLVGTSACVEIRGGAVELSWSFQNFQGGPIEPDDDCAATQVSQVRLRWESAPWNQARSSGTTTFPCTAFRGITDFVIGAGPQLLEIEPVCASGAMIEEHTYAVPAPLLRTVIEGEVVTLDSLLIVTDDDTGENCACCP